MPNGMYCASNSSAYVFEASVSVGKSKSDMPQAGTKPSTNNKQFASEYNSKFGESTIFGGVGHLPL